MTPAPLSRPGRVRDFASARPLLEKLDEAVRMLREAQSLVIATHIHPDGDAIGSAAALGAALRSLGKRARVVLGEEPPENLRGLIPASLFEVIPDPAVAARLAPSDLCVLLDTSEPQRAGVFQELFFAAGQKRLCVDHHPTEVTGRFDAQLIVTQAPATGDLVLAIIDRLGVELTAEIAQALWIAIATDTGWFRFENTSSWALEDASRLAGAGVKAPELYRRLYEELPAPKARVLGRVLAGLRTDLGGAFVWSVSSRADLESEGVAVGDLDGIVDHLKAIRGAKVAALVVETENGRFKVSLRAPGDGVEVESIARRFGGGGHLKAAGCRFSGTLDELAVALTAAVREKLG
jgi:phosphoesterase RecJ-like protein